MKTIESIIAQFTGPAMLDELADLLRIHEPDFPEIEKKYKDAVSILATSTMNTLHPTVDEYIAACQQDVIANLLYAGYLGYRANLQNFQSPYTTNFVAMDFTDYIRDHLMGHFAVCCQASNVKDAFRKCVPSELVETIDIINEYFILLDTVGPKLAHYAGYIISNLLLPWMEPGYREDYAQTMLYKEELKKHMGYLPL